MSWTVDNEEKIFNVPAQLTNSYLCVFCNAEVGFGVEPGFEMAKYKDFDIPICPECRKEKWSNAEIESALAESNIHL
jgi:hypothetical protein